MHKEALVWSENPRHFNDQREHYQSNLVNTVSETNTKTAAVLKSNVYSHARAPDQKHGRQDASRHR